MAAITAEEVAVELLARYDKMDRQLRAAENVVDRRLGNMEGRGAAFVSRFNGLLAGVSVAALGKEFLDLADASKQIDAQLKLATRAFGSFGQAQTDVARIAGEARNGLSEAAALYGNLVRATASLGGTQLQAARATETFSKALKLGGADAAQTASATLQFGQALASGVLRGDEFNSIAEASPRLLQLVADALGKPKEELRALAEQGKLTSDVLFRALTDKRFTAGIDDEFKTLPVTFSDAMQQVENAATLTFGAFDRGGNFSTSLASFVTDGSNGFRGLANAAEKLGADVRATFAGLSDVFEPLVAAGEGAFGTITRQADYARDTIANILRLYDKVQNADVGFDRFYTRAARAVMGKSTTEADLPQYSDRAGTFTRQYDSRRMQSAEERFTRTFRGQIGLNPGSIISNPAPPRPYVRPAAAASSKKTGGASADTAARRAEAERQKELRNDEAFANEKAGLNQDLLRARRAAATAADTVAQFELQEISIARDRQNSSYQRDVTEKKLTQARANELVALNNQVAAARAAHVQAERDERARADRAAVSQADLGNARDLASIDVDLATTTRARRDAALRLLDVEFQLERSRLDAVLASQESTEAEREIARRRLATLPQIESNERAGVNQQYAGPVGQYTSRLRASVGDMDEALEGVAANGLATVEDGLTSIVTGTQSVGDAFKQMADRIIADLIRIAVQKAILAAIGGSADTGFGAAGSGGGGGGVAGFIGTLFGAFARSAGGRASGGYVAPHSIVNVNEGARRGPELLRMGSAGGTVIPLGQANAVATRAAAPQPVVVQLVVGKGQMFEPAVRQISGQVSVQTVQAAAPDLIKAGGRAGVGMMNKSSRLGTY